MLLELGRMDVQDERLIRLDNLVAVRYFAQCSKLIYAYFLAVEVASFIQALRGLQVFWI